MTYKIQYDLDPCYFSDISYQAPPGSLHSSHSGYFAVVRLPQILPPSSDFALADPAPLLPNSGITHFLPLDFSQI